MDQMPANFRVLRNCAVTLPEVTEGLHRGGAAFRYKGRKFALWWMEGRRVIMKLDRTHQDFLFDLRGDIFEQCKVGTGVWSFVDLDKLDPEEIRHLTLEAFATVAPRRLTDRLVTTGQALHRVRGDG